VTGKGPKPRPLLRRIIPESLATVLGECRGMPVDKALSYLRLRAWRRMGLRRDRAILERRRPESILFVCHGNILRSPMAAELFRARMADRGRAIGALSAGLWTVNGRPADPRAIAAAHKFGVSLESHLSRSVTPSLVARSDLICVMDYRNEVDVVTRFPGAGKKTVLLGAFDTQASDSPEVRDPVSLSAEGVERCYARLASAVDALAQALDPE
jgi:protein-tyrosine phosphatase